MSIDLSCQTNSISILCIQILVKMLRDYNTEEITSLLEDYYDINGQIKQLGGYTDRNYLIVHQNHQQFILKISSSLQNSTLIHIQNIVLNQLRHFDLPLKCKFPSIIKTKESQDMIVLQEGTKQNHIRLFSYIEGRQFWEIENPPVHLYREAGQLASRLSIFLEHLTKTSEIQISLKEDDCQFHYFNICTFNNHYDRYIEYIDQDVKGLVNQAKQEFNQILPLLQTVPKQIVHNDICLSNLLVSQQEGEMFISGLIDFSSMIYTYRIIQLVILCARINLYEPQPLRNILLIVKAYNNLRKLTKEEMTVLFPLIKVRLAFLSLLSCYFASTKSHDAYFVKCKSGHIHYLKTISKCCQNDEFGKLMHNECSQASDS